MEQDQKDIVIAQLKAENFELKQKERDYNILNSQLTDLERRFRMLQDEKFRAEKEAKEREVLTWQKTDNLQAELKMVSGTLENRRKELKDMETELYAYKGLLDDKDSELVRLRREQTDRETDNLALSKGKRALEADLMNTKDSRLAAQKEADGLAAVNERLDKERALVEDNARDAEREAALLRKKIEDAEIRLELAKKDRLQKETELDVVLDGKKATRQDADKITLANIRFENENRDISLKIKDIELQLAKTRQRYDDSLALLDAKEKELARAKSGLTYTEDRSLTAGAELRKLREDNETLQRLLDRYRKDVDFQKKLREIEAQKKLDLELEKRKLENEALSKEIEARSAKKELEKIRDTHGQLLEDHHQLHDELSALKQHAEVLENQNATLHNELDRFVETDEKVRRDLDRKPHVDYIKSKNTEELQQSIMKVRESLSPAKRSPSKSSYSSPHRTPGKN